MSPSHRSGAPRSWDPDRDFVQVSRDAIRQLGPVAAIVFSHVLYRCKFNERGQWRATLTTIADETGIPKRTVERAVKTLRDEAVLTSVQENQHDVTLTWSIRWDVADTSADLADPLRRSGGPPSANMAGSPIDVVEDLEDTHAADAASALDRVLAHHGQRVAAWSSPPRITSTAREAAGALLDEHTEAEVIAVIDWCQREGCWWRTRTRTLAKVAQHFDTIRAQRADERSNVRNLPNRDAVSDEHRAEIVKAFGG